MTINRDTIINAKDIPIATVQIPEWGGEAFVRRQNIRERDFLIPISDGFLEIKPPKKEGEAPIFKMKEGEDAEKAYAKHRLFTVGFALCDENGVRLFNDDEIESVLGAKSPVVIERIYRDLGNVFKADAEQVVIGDSASA
ncbi:MAG: hypothetical protein PHI47_06525 [Sulfuricurvum sp.]|uniref:hypothetical protein n=1 Tax=Sulfuricurvum sp. TaxID=2025608 RepID=UPI00262A11A1|nr:hypothetical protein [Sulfuricurvum sp.]MDD5159689.1 hypothetical protein [Sulfuricurvum sp.]